MTAQIYDRTGSQRIEPLCVGAVPPSSLVASQCLPTTGPGMSAPTCGIEEYHGGPRCMFKPTSLVTHVGGGVDKMPAKKPHALCVETTKRKRTKTNAILGCSHILTSPLVHIDMASVKTSCHGSGMEKHKGWQQVAKLPPHQLGFGPSPMNWH